MAGKFRVGNYVQIQTSDVRWVFGRVVQVGELDALVQWEGDGAISTRVRHDDTEVQVMSGDAIEAVRGRLAKIHE